MGGTFRRSSAAISVKRRITVRQSCANIREKLRSGARQHLLQGLRQRLRCGFLQLMPVEAFDLNRDTAVIAAQIDCELEQTGIGRFGISHRRCVRLGRYVVQENRTRNKGDDRDGRKKRSAHRILLGKPASVGP
jgi:hypothetical protein